MAGQGQVCSPREQPDTLSGLQESRLCFRLWTWGQRGPALTPQDAAGPFSSWALPDGGIFSLLQARRQFQSQLADLQQLPDILKITEAKLAECQDQLQGYERKNIDLTAIISDLRSRVREWQKGTHELTRSGVRLPR